MTVYIDMDGVLAVWDSSTSAENTKSPGYFLEREEEPVIVALIKALQKLNTDVCILSAVWNERCALEKSIWLDKRFGKGLNRIFVPVNENKADYILGGNNILIDDYTKNLVAWQKSGNKPIKFYNDINGTNGTYQGTFITKNMSVGEMLEIIADTIDAA